MDFRRPLATVAPTLDADVLAVLAQASAELTGAEVCRLIGTASDRGVARVLHRLTEQGIVERRSAGPSYLYRLNRDHLGAEAVMLLATAHRRLVERLRAQLAAWDPEARGGWLFGSVARGEAGPESDIDLLILRDEDVDPEHDLWAEQVAELERTATACTGNDARVIEYGAQELPELVREPLWQEVQREGIELVPMTLSLQDSPDMAAAVGTTRTGR